MSTPIYKDIHSTSGCGDIIYLIQLFAIKSYEKHGDNEDDSSGDSTINPSLSV